MRDHVKNTFLGGRVDNAWDISFLWPRWCRGDVLLGPREGVFCHLLDVRNWPFDAGSGVTGAVVFFSRFPVVCRLVRRLGSQEAGGCNWKLASFTMPSSVS